MLQELYLEYSFKYHFTDNLFVFVCRDLVHRQTAMSAIGHLALGVYGFGCEDALNHILNYVWPNIFESSPHVVQAFMAAIEGIMVGLGPTKILQYCLQVSCVLCFQILIIG